MGDGGFEVLKKGKNPEVRRQLLPGKVAHNCSISELWLDATV